MKKIIIISLLVLILLCGCDKKIKVDKKDNSIKIKILENFKEISNSSNMTSSNPYDYTKNKYYDNIVELGTPAINVLENMYYNGELVGLDAYLSALIIQDISKCNLYKKYGLDWSTADEFYELWKKYNCNFNEN